MSRKSGKSVAFAARTISVQFAVCALLALGLARSLADERATVPQELTLADALRLANEYNPALRGERFDLLAFDGRKQQARARRNPELGLEFENFAGSGDLSGSEALETTLALSQLVQLGGKQDARVNLVESELEVVQSEYAIRRLDLHAEVARRFIRLVADQEHLSVARRSTQLTQDFLAGVSQRVQAARSPIAEESRASIAQARAELEEAQLERSVESSRRTLAASWGASQAQFTIARADLQHRPPVADFETLAGRLASTPELARHLSEQRLREAELRLAEATRTPDLTLAAGIRRFEETGDHAFVFSFSVPLPLADRNQGAIAESRARLNKVSIDREAALLDAQTRLFEFYQGLLQAGAEADTLQAQVIPKAREALAQTESGYERGRFSYLEVTEARRELIELERIQIEAAATYHLVLNEIERLTTQPLAVPAQQRELP
jgi:cobalt-zinc-cadmium efflux system outer membrane protein